MLRTHSLSLSIRYAIDDLLTHNDEDACVGNVKSIIPERVIQIDLAKVRSGRYDLHHATATSTIETDRTQ